MNDTQKEFEEFVKREFEQLKNPCLDYDSKDNSYDDGYVDSAWAGWQACQNLNNERIAELEAKIKELNEQLDNAVEHGAGYNY